MIRRALLGLVMLAATPLPALAHPHIFIDAKATIVFDDAGDVAGIRHSWTFDESFSTWQIQGLDQRRRRHLERGDAGARR